MKTFALAVPLFPGEKVRDGGAMIHLGLSKLAETTGDEGALVLLTRFFVAL